jgi:hypothetical protein
VVEKRLKMEQYDSLKLSNQVCFPLYVASKEIIRKYNKFLKELDLTYTQYITMMVMWEVEKENVKDLGEKLYLDSGTLTPLLRKLENKGYIKREKSKEDERNLSITLTNEGKALKEKAKNIPIEMMKCINLPLEELINLKDILNKIIGEK